jgi:hypothetical protein
MIAVTFALKLKTIVSVPELAFAALIAPRRVHVAPWQVLVSPVELTVNVFGAATEAAGITSATPTAVATASERTGS